MALARRAVELAAPPGLVVGSLAVLYFLPPVVLDFLTAWTLLSLPLGVIIGHCALGDD